MKKLFVVSVLFIFGLISIFAQDRKLNELSEKGDLQALLDYVTTLQNKEVNLAGKTYRIEKPVVLTPKHNGLKIDGQGAIITGSRMIKGWRKSVKFKGAWEADFKYDTFITSLFVNGVRANCAKTPNDTRFLAHSRIEDGSQHGSPKGMYVSLEDGGNILASLTSEQIKDCFVGTFRNWVQVNVPLKSVEKTDDPKKMKVMFSSSIKTSMFRNCKYSSFLIFNIPSAMDVAGEFYFDRSNSKIYYLPRENEDISTAVVEFPHVEIPFEILGKYDGKNVERVKNITIKKITFAGGGVGFDKKLKGKGILFFLNNGQSATDSIACVKVSFADNIKLHNCIFTKTDSYGLWIADGVKLSEVKGCEFTDLGLGGIKIGNYSMRKYVKHNLIKELAMLGTENIKICDNAVYKYGRFSMSASGILAFDVARCKIIHNEVFDGYYTGISYGWCWGSGETFTTDGSISYNKIHVLSFGNTNDIGGIYTLGTSPNSKITGNVIWNIECLDYGAWGIYNDEGSNGWIISRNYVRNSSKGGYFMHYGKDCKIYNNIIRDCKDYQVGLGRMQPNSYIFERNIIEYSSPATVLRGNNLIPHKAGAFNSNIYFNKGGKLDFGGLNFEQWQATGQDKDSFVEKLDIDEIIEKSLPVEKIDFKPLKVKKAGIRVKKLREKIDNLLKDYKYPPMFKHNFKLPEIMVDDKMIGRLPAASGTICNPELLKVQKEDKKRFTRITDTFKDYRPYFAYKYQLDSADFIKYSFEIRLHENSSLLLEPRPNLGGGNGLPQMRIYKNRIAGTTLPMNKWLKVEAVLPNHVNADKKFDVKIYDENSVIFSKKFPYTTQAAKFYTLFFIAINGGNGEIIDISNVRIVPANESKK